MKKGMFWITGILLLCLIGTGVALWLTQWPWVFPVFITCGTTFYHFAMRLAVGYTIHGCFHNKINYRRWWFRQRKWEQGMYRLLGVRRWKKHIPAFEPENFDVKHATAEQIIGSTCQAEVVHEVIMGLSFLPILAIPWLGEPAVFCCTSVAAALFDAVFVILQRFNRPRFMKLLQRQGAKTNGEYCNHSIGPEVCCH